LFTGSRSSCISHLVLSHLSKENNTHEIVDQLFRPHALHTDIVIASRYRETPVYEIPVPPQASPAITVRRQLVNVQLSLF
jgi:hypothetical protein